MFKFRKASLAATGLSALLTVAAPFAGATAAPGTQATSNLGIEAAVVPVISISCDQALVFGEMITNATGGTVVVDPTGAAKYAVTGLVADTSDLPNRGHCTVSGDGDDSYYVTMPTSATLVHGNDTLTVSKFSAFGDWVFSGGEGNLSKKDLYIGGTLTIPANAPIGLYNGSVPVTVNYIL